MQPKKIFRILILVPIFVFNFTLGQNPHFIRSVSPLIGSSEKTLTITGINFPPLTSGLTVSFGGVKGSILSASKTQITTTIPTGALLKNISVAAGGFVSYYPYPFSLTFSQGKYITSSSYRRKTDLPIKELPKDITIGDLNGDGFHDLVISNTKNNTLSIFINGNNFNFLQKFELNCGTSPQGVLIADVDSDGKNDVLVANQASHSISIFRNNFLYGELNAANFSKFDFKVEERPYKIAVFDIERDGRNEILVTNEGKNTISILRGIAPSENLPINFSSKFSLETGQRPKEIEIADMDRDGKGDIVCVNEYSNSISIFRNISTRDSLNKNSFEQRVDLLVSSKPNSLALADLNNDKRLDIIIAHGDEDYFSIIKNKSIADSLTFDTFDKPVDFKTSGAQDDICAGDFDGDGKIDVCVVTGSNYLSVHKNEGGFNFSTLKNRVNFTTGTGPISVTSGDLDGDSKPEILTVNKGLQTVSIFQNTIGPPVISKISPTIVTSGGTVIISGDHLSATKKIFFGNLPAVNFNIVNDSLVAAVIGKGESGIVKLETPAGSAWVEGLKYIQKPNIYSIEPETGFPGEEIKIIGLNFHSEKEKNQVWFGKVKAEVKTAASEELIVKIPSGATYEPISITVDGVTAYSPKKFSIKYKGVGIATEYFVNKTNRSTLYNLSKIVLADVDLNGKLDIIGLNKDIDTLSLFNNSETTTENVVFQNLEDPVNSKIGIKGEDLVVADLNGDEQFEVIVSHYYTGILSLYRNRPTPLIVVRGFHPFVDRMELKTGLFPKNVAVGDIDGDGKLDIAVSNYGSYDISLFRNLSSGKILNANSFAERVDIPSGNKPWGIEIADIDGDKKNDIIVTNSGENTINIFRNVGNIGFFSTSSFEAPIVLKTGKTPTSLAIVDLNNDGRNEIAVINRNETSITVFPNKGNVGIIKAEDFIDDFKISILENPFKFTANDIDGDGLCDFGIISSGGNVTLLQNILKDKNLTKNSFSSRANFSAGELLNNISIADIDNDGKNDILLCSDSTKNIKVYYNNIPEYVEPDTFKVTKPLGANLTIYPGHYSLLGAYFTGKSTKLFAGVSYTKKFGIDLGMNYLIRSSTYQNFTPFFGMLGNLSFGKSMGGSIAFPIGIEYQDNSGLTGTVGMPLELYPGNIFTIMVSVGFYF